MTPQKPVAWAVDKLLITAALAVLFIALAFSAVEAGAGWVAKRLFQLTEKIR